MGDNASLVLDLVRGARPTLRVVGCEDKDRKSSGSRTVGGVTLMHGLSQRRGLPAPGATPNRTEARSAAGRPEHRQPAKTARDGERLSRADGGHAFTLVHYVERRALDAPVLGRGER